MKKTILLLFTLSLFFSNISFGSAASQYKNDTTYTYNGETNAKGLYDGFGKLYYKDVLLYEGDFNNHQFEGEGTLYHVSTVNKKRKESKVLNKKKYEGSFLKGMYHGEGTLYFETVSTNKIHKGIKYQGKFKYGEYHGYGIEYSEDGSVLQKGYYLNGQLYSYKGEVDKNSKMHGRGRLFDKNGKLMFDGDFVHGEIQGKGTMYNTNRNMKYVGTFEHDLLNGEGTVYMNDKLYYNGPFKKGVMEGEGILYLQNEKVAYKGQFNFNRTKEQPFQVKAELKLNSDMSATYTVYFALLNKYNNKNTLEHFNLLKEQAKPQFDSVKDDSNKQHQYISFKATKKIRNLSDELFIDKLLGLNVVLNKTKLMIYEQLEMYTYLSEVSDSNLMTIDYEVILPNGATNIYRDPFANEILPQKQFAWEDIIDNEYKFIQFEKKNFLNMSILILFLLVLIGGLFYFRKQKKRNTSTK